MLVVVASFLAIFTFYIPEAWDFLHISIMLLYYMQVPCSEHLFWPIEAHVRCVRVESNEMNL